MDRLRGNEFHVTEGDFTSFFTTLRKSQEKPEQ